MVFGGRQQRDRPEIGQAPCEACSLIYDSRLETQSRAQCRMSEEEKLLDDLDDVKFRIGKSMRYHQSRRAYYDQIHRMYVLGVIISGSTAFGDLFDAPELFGLAAASLGALDLTLAFSHKARDHEIIHKQFADLAADIELEVEPTSGMLRSWRSRILRIESSEPPVYWALEQDCHLEVAQTWRREPEAPPLTWFRRALMQFVRFEHVSETAAPN